MSRPEFWEVVGWNMVTNLFLLKARLCLQKIVMSNHVQRIY
ncbi:unnamed protein product [Aphis gossypii]|uniref:Uncharacterized protein n=1 Tax=Aphis gossypii TaxID=80765 RepID=A0A9P0JIH7_APHGO|nr:unnamed protein product [Aphis gossypii]